LTIILYSSDILSKEAYYILCMKYSYKGCQKNDHPVNLISGHYPEITNFFIRDLTTEISILGLQLLVIQKHRSWHVYNAHWLIMWSSYGTHYESCPFIHLLVFLSLCAIYRVAQKSKLLHFFHIFAKYWLIFTIFFTSRLCKKFAT